MLFPAEAERRAILDRLRPLAGRTGGSLHEDFHVTVGYFRGEAAVADVVGQLRRLDGPAIVVHASGLFSFSDAPNPLFGWTLSLRVRRSGPVRAWQRQVRDALGTLPLSPVFTWREQRPHMLVLQHLPASPSDTLSRLDHPHPGLTFTASRLVVTERRGDTFLNHLEQPLRGQQRATQPPGRSRGAAHRSATRRRRAGAGAWCAPAG